MILVQNLRQLLNGSNSIFYVLFCLLMAMSLSSCDGFKKAQGNGGDDRSELDPISGKPRYNPKTGKYETTSKVTEKMETVEWNEPTNQVPPITSDSNGGSNTSTTDTTTPVDTETPDTEVPSSTNLGTYNVAVMLPFLSHKFDTGTGQIYEKSKLAINFYGGMKMAFEELQSQGVAINMSVFDSKASEVEVNNLLNNPEINNANVIIGPVKGSNLKKVAAFAKDNKVPLISPLNPSANITQNNPYYIQLSPTLESHCKAITKHVKERYSTDQVVLLCRNKPAEVGRLKYFQNENHEIDGSADSEEFREFLVPDNSSEYNNIDVTPYLLEDKPTVFIVPSWSSESFINALLRVVRLAKYANIETGGQDIIVYGMPKWREYTRVSFDNYEDLNVHISNETYLDPTSPSVQGFRQLTWKEINIYLQDLKSNHWLLLMLRVKITQ